MSEDGSRTPDLSKIIGVIMENPDIIEKISRLAQSSPATDEKPHSDVTPPGEPTSVTASVPERSKRRAQLLTAIKPYVKSSRADAIDSVIAIADIIDMMRRK